MRSSDIHSGIRPLKVKLGQRSYPIYIGLELIGRIGELLNANFGSLESCIIVTAPEINRLHSASMVESLEGADIDVEVLLIPEGEEAKSWDVAGRLLGQLVDLGLDRKSTIIAFGGGSVGDLAGFVSAIYMRGVRLIQVPTTLLAQVDSSIGGKVAVNHPKGKNLIGAFHQPSIVVVDPSLLETLPRREFISGLGEVVKYGMIADAEIFSTLENKTIGSLKQDMRVLIDVITRCCTVKAGLVELDERDTKGIRAALNYGHTVGHSLEITDMGIKHGEAVALGMRVAAKIANNLDLIENSDVERQRRLLEKMELKKELPDLDPSVLVKVMRRDKKAEGGDIRFVLPTGVGSPPLIRAVTEDLISWAMEMENV